MTSSDALYNGLEALWQIVRGTMPTVVALALLLAVVGVWQHVSPVGFPLRGEGVDREIIGTQIERAETLAPDIDVLILGDSSGLMGIDAPLLSQGLGGASVESLSTLGFIGARGYAAILDRFVRRGGRAARLLIVLESSGLTRRHQWAGYERMATGGIAAPVPPTGLVAGIRARLLAVAEPFLFVPLSGHFGDFYGTSPSLADFIRSHHGSAIEPGPALPDNERPREGIKPYRERAAERFAMNEAFTEGLPTLATSIARFGRDKVRVVLMPQLSWFDPQDTERRRDTAFNRLRRELNLDASAQLDLPVTLPASWFASETHLNRKGRLDFTAILADALITDRQRFGWDERAAPQ